MRGFTSPVAVLFSAALFCLAAPSLAAEHEKSPTGEDVSEEISEALGAIAAYSVDQRDLTLARARAMLDSLDTRIERMGRRLDSERAQMSESARQSMRRTLQELRERRTEVAEW
jgi:hypothetical protein